jgi:methylenetetrahydrofolate dehydrogenase (NAD+)
VTPLAESLRSKVREFTSKKHKTGSLKLIGILANEGAHRLDSEIYSDRIQQTFEEDGIDYEVWKYPACGGEDDPSGLDEEKRQQTKLQWIKDKIRTINSSSDIDGTLVFYPIHPFGPKGPYKCRLTGVYYKTQDDHIRDLIHPSKDVEGLCGTKWFQIRDSRQKDPPSIYPCTALSVLRILEEYHIGSDGKNTHGGNDDDGAGNNNNNNSKREQRIQQCWKDQTISIVNRSEIMGRPLAVMLAEKGATVYSIDIDSILQFRPDGKRLRRCNPTTTTLKSCLKESTVVVAGVPSADFRLPLSSIKQGSTIVSVSEFPNVCETTLFQERPDIKYIPQVGKVTVASLSQNLMHLKQNKLKLGDDGGPSDPNE